MSLTVIRPLPAFLTGLLVFLMLLAPLAMPGRADEQGKPARRQPAEKSTAQRLGLYSPRVRRSTITYLRLRLLELHEEGLDRARAAIERRLSVDELIYGAGERQPKSIPSRESTPQRAPNR